MDFVKVKILFDDMYHSQILLRYILYSYRD